MSTQERFICLLALASNLSCPSLSTFSKPFEEHYAQLKQKIETLCLPFLKWHDGDSKKKTLSNLLKCDDYLGVSILVALDLDGGDQNPLYNNLIDSSCNGSIASAGHEQATRHLAVCFYMRKEYLVAFEIVDQLASNHPEWLDIQILAAEILAELQGAEDKAKNRFSTIRQAYKLTSDLESRLSAAEAIIEKRLT